jgi:hypothetical protein
MAFLLCLLPAVAFGQLSDDGLPVKAITDASIVGTVVFSSDTVYNLQGFVFVDAGETLEIEPGTIIKANTGQGVNATALIVSQGGTIDAQGTASLPIIFTSIDDDIDDNADIPAGEFGRGLWGGVILLGEATINTTAGVGNVEGLAPSVRTEYGGINDADNSGIMTYVSIRHGGSVFGSADEINGLTLGGVGSGTTLDHIEVFQNLDDGIEMFGGTVSLKHVVVAFCGDDSFDFDEGYSGGGQYWFTIMDEENSGQGGEHDGGTTPENGTPFATPLISNATYLGAGYQAATAQNDGCFNIRDNCSPAYYNSIFSDHNGSGVRVEQSGSEPTDSEDRLLAGDLVFQNNAWGLFSTGTHVDEVAAGQAWTATLFTTQEFENWLTDPGISVSRTADQQNDPRPKYTASFPLWTDPTVYNPPAKPGFGAGFAGFFDAVNYIGAFDPTAPLSSSWAAGWTAFDFYGYLGEVSDACTMTDNGKPVKAITNAGIVGEVFFSRDTVYNLQGFVFVEDGEVLTIEAGTIIKSNTGQGTNATALIVSKGGQLYAQGTAECPIIFTTIDDDIDDNADIPAGEFGRGLWGGVILLGEAEINTTAGVGNVEGLAPSTSTEYGGADDFDNSGVMHYVSIRHGGSVFGSADEINGLTLGGIGRNTQFAHIEVFQNLDDGIEMFGGVPSLKYVIAAFCGDDAFDFDEGYSGGGQYWFSIMDEENSGQGGEHDGGTTPENGTPFATPVISNATLLGAGYQAATAQNDGCFNVRDNCSPAYYNSIFSDHNGSGIRIEQSGSEPTDSEDRLLAGDLVYQNNVWGLFAVGNSTSAIAGGQTWTETLFTNVAFNNDIEDPEIFVTRAADMMNDPRPKNATAKAFPNWTSPTAYNPPAKPGFGGTFASYFDAVDYLGAFDPDLSISENWLLGWTAFDTYGYLGENNGSVSCCVGETGDLNSDGNRTLTDLTQLVNFLFVNFVEPACMPAANTNGDAACAVTLTDLTRLVNKLFVTFVPCEPCATFDNQLCP